MSHRNNDLQDSLRIIGLLDAPKQSQPLQMAYFLNTNEINMQKIFKPTNYLINALVDRRRLYI